MSGLLEQLRTVIQKINQLDISYALIGGLAVSVYATPRTTRDIDLAVAIESKADQEQLPKKLLAAGFFNDQLIVQVAPLQKLGLRVHVSATSPVPLDLLYSSSGIEKEVVEAANEIEVFPSLNIRVATPAHLLAMKIVSENDSDRLQDRLDIKGLLKVISKDEIEIAKNAMRLIEERKFNRGKDLISRLEELLIQLA